MQWEHLDVPQVSGAPPSGRISHGMVAIGTDLYIFGGIMWGGLKCSDLFRFSTTAKHWEHLDTPEVSGSRPWGRGSHGMISMGVDFYVFWGKYRFAFVGLREVVGAVSLLNNSDALGTD